MSRPLAPLLAPRSIAVVGASPKQGSVGQTIIHGALVGGFDGKIYPVNPKYGAIGDLACYPSLGDLPGPVEHAVLAVADHRVEGQLVAAIEAGAKAASIYGSCYLEEDIDPPLTKRLAALAHEAGLAICGANGMGFYNNVENTYLCISSTPMRLPRGSVALILHSGSVFSAFANSESRLEFSYVVSAGQELTTSVADYLDFFLDDAGTRVVGLFLEAVRDPQAFEQALEKAQTRDVPIVVLKVGRSEIAARMAVNHSGAMVGNAAAYGAVFERYGVIAVDSLDEFAATLALFESPRRAGPGGVATIHDSGGEREMLADVAEVLDVPLARLSPATESRLGTRLDAGLEPGNPLDAWGTGHDYEGIFRDCFQALVDDPDTAIGFYNADIGDDRELSLGYIRACVAVSQATDKPVAFTTNLSNLPHTTRFAELKAAGVPLLEGTGPSLLAARHLMTYRDFRGRSPDSPPASPAEDVVSRWRARLSTGNALDEAAGLGLLADYGIEVPANRIIETAADLSEAAHAIGYPVVLKTAMTQLHHKSDVGGVKLGLTDEAALIDAYRDFAERLGPRALVAAMVPPGVEMALGLSHDPQFGPLVMIASGGIFIELLGDARYALPPFDRAAALRLIDGLRSRLLLDGLRGLPAANLEALGDALARFSVLAADLGDLIAEADVNPLIASPDGCMAVDALIVPRTAP